MPPLEFQINLAGSLTSELGRASRALGETEKNAHGAAHGVGVFEAEIGKLSQGVGGLNFNLSALAKGGAGLFTFDMAEGAELVIGAFEKIGELAERAIEKVIDLGKEFIKTAAESSDLELSVNLVFGEDAEAIRKIGEQFQEKSRFNAEEIEKLLVPLGQAGIKDTAQIGRLATAATDIAAFGNTGMAGAQAAIDALTKMQLKGAVGKETFRSLFLEQKVFYADLGEELGVSADTAKKMATKGKVDTDRLMDFTLREIAAKQGTPGELGTATEKSAKTLGGALKRLEDVPGNFMRKLAESPAVGSLATFLDRLVTELDPNGPTGTKIIAAIGSITDRIMGAFGDIDLGDTITELSNGLIGIADGFKQAWPSIKEFAGALEDAVGWTYKMVKGGILLAQTLGVLPKSVEQLRFDAFQESKMRVAAQAKDRAMNALFYGDANTGKKVEAKTAALAQDTTASGAMSMADQTQSLPHMASGGIVDRPTVALIGEAGPEAVVPLDRIGGGSSSVSIGDIHVHVATSTADHDPGSLGLEIGQSVRLEIKKLLDEVGYATGAATS